jgi:hypothetical protein
MALNYLDELLKSQGGWGPDQATQFDPMSTDSRLGNAPQVAKDANALDMMFQGAIMSGDIEKAARLAVTPQQQALLSVAYGNRINQQDYRARMDNGIPTQAPPDLIKNYNDQQYTNTLRSQAAQDRQMKIKAMQDASALSQAHTAQAKASTLNATLKPVTQPPAGYRPTQGGNLEAIPGGPADMKNQAAFSQDTATLQSSMADLDRLATSANELLQSPGLERITGIPGKFGNVPGMAGANAAAKLETLKSQIGFGVLQAMRNASKTGGALGNVSDAEGKRLEANLAALDTSQSTEDFAKGLKKVIDFSNQAKQRLADSYKMHYGARLGDNPVPTGIPPQSAQPPLGQVAGQPAGSTVRKYNSATGRIE